MDPATKTDLEGVLDKFTKMLKSSVKELHGSIEENNRKQIDHITALEENIDSPTHPKGSPGFTKAPIFKGDRNDDPATFLLQFKQYATYFGWNEEQTLKAFPLSLQGIASIWYNSLDKIKLEEPDSLYKLFSERFLSPADNWALRQELNQRKQGPNESLADYSADMRKRFLRLEIPETETIFIYVNGLKPHLRSHVVLQQPKSLEEAETLAKIKNSVTESSPKLLNAETASSLMQSISQLKDTLAQQNKPVAAYEEQNRAKSEQTNESDIRRIIRQELRNIQGPSSRPNAFNARPNFDRGNRTTTGQVVCRRCGRVGHFARNCYAQGNDPRIPRNFHQTNAPTFAARSQSRPQFRPNQQTRQQLN